MNLGDYAEDYATLNFKFTTRNVQGAGSPPFALASGVISVYKGSGTSASTAGITLAADFNSVTGLNNVLIDLSADAFYVTGQDYHAVITTGTVNSISVVGEVVAQFSIENRFNALNDTARAEPAQGAPGATVTTSEKIDWLYKAWRNKTTSTATQYNLYNDDTSTIDTKATLAEDGTTASRAEMVSGP